MICYYAQSKLWTKGPHPVAQFPNIELVLRQLPLSRPAHRRGSRAVSVTAPRAYPAQGYGILQAHRNYLTPMIKQLPYSGPYY